MQIDTAVGGRRVALVVVDDRGVGPERLPPTVSMWGFVTLRYVSPSLRCGQNDLESSNASLSRVDASSPETLSIVPVESLAHLSESHSVKNQTCLEFGRLEILSLDAD